VETVHAIMRGQLAQCSFFDFGSERESDNAPILRGDAE
jgi:hypothetical protein